MTLTFLTSFSRVARIGTPRLASRIPVCSRRKPVPVRMCVTHAGTAPPAPSMVRARHILVESEAMVDALREQLEGGAEFATLAETVSTCPSKARGGDLGWFKRQMMVPEFEEAAFGNPPGSVVKVNTQFGWHLIRIDQHGIVAGEISVNDLAARFPQGYRDVKNVQFVDCREREELEKSKLDGWLNLPMGEFGEWADKFEKGELGLRKNVETIVMCHHGIRSANFCAFLSQEGFSNVKNLVGGIDAYSVRVDSDIPRY